MNDNREMHPYVALEIYGDQVKTNPQNAPLHMRYGNVLPFPGYLDMAIVEYQAELGLDPMDIESTINLGTIYVIQGTFDSALKMLQRASTLEAGRNIPAEDDSHNLSIIDSRLEPF